MGQAFMPGASQPQVFYCAACNSFTVDHSPMGFAAFGPPDTWSSFEVFAACGNPDCSEEAKFVGNYLNAVTEHGMQIQASDPATLASTVEMLLAMAKAEQWTPEQVAEVVEKIDGRFHRLAAWFRDNDYAAVLIAAVATPVVLSVMNFLLVTPGASVDEIDRMLREHPPAVTVVIDPPSPSSVPDPEPTVRPSDHAQQSESTGREGEQHQDGDR